MTAPAASPGDSDTKLRAVPFTQVHVDDTFWRPRLDVNRATTIRYCFDRCEDTGRLANFARAAGRLPGAHEGHRYNDSDVFKVIEGAAYALSVQPDAELEAFVDALIEDIAGAQEEDGYLFTKRTIDPDAMDRASGLERWSYIAHSHELYNVGHMYEAAVAYFDATGKRALLDVAIRNADLIDATFGPGKRHDPPGHQEIEIGLVRLYRATGEQRYLDLAEFFLDRRGRPEGRDSLYGDYSQDHVPVTEQTEPVGHAVRAMYQYCGMADVAAETGNDAYIRALDRIWNTMVTTKLYLTGGIGARHSGEAFGDPYELPNESAYNETCAAIGSTMWNHRMGLLHRDAKYFDVMERTLYNGMLSGVSLNGDRFFYPNPLASGGTYERSPWFSCSCCPVNVVRAIPSMTGSILAQDNNTAYVNLYVGSAAELELSGTPVNLTQRTEYPWDGHVTIEINPERAATFGLALRIPGWALGRPVPSNLYSYLGPEPIRPPATLRINGTLTPLPTLDHGYAVITREWRPGDVVTIEFAMPIRRVQSHPAVDENRGRLAFERGPIVYCFEAVDNGGTIRNLWIPPGSTFKAEHRHDLLGGVTVLRGIGQALRIDDDRPDVTSVPIELTAIPYHVWEHRAPGEMAVWMPATGDGAQPLPAPTLASRSRATASHCYSGDSPRAMNDQRTPRASNDHSIPRLTWWDHRGTREWVQYDFVEPTEISHCAVYWFDDTGRGECRLPESWRMLVRHDGAWVPVSLLQGQAFETRGDTMNAVEFDAVTTDAVRLEVQLRDGFSGGILEWQVR